MTGQSSTAEVVDAVGEKIVHEGPGGEATTHGAPIGANAGPPGALLDLQESGRLHTRWNEIQGRFVDEPRSAVEQAALSLLLQPPGDLRGRPRLTTDRGTSEWRRA